MHGIPPTQQITEDITTPSSSENTEGDVEEDFYGDENFEEGELDIEGFEINE